MSSATGGKNIMIVVTNYFTKWFEAEAMTTTTQMDIERFIWKNIGETLFSLAYGYEAIIFPNVVVLSINTVLPNFE
ncbi:hypothetical protein FF1_003471 [Malus domestica]